MKKFISIFCLLLFIGLYVKAQEKIYLSYFDVINIHTDYQLSTARLFKLYAEKENKMEIYLPEKDSGYFHQNKEEAFSEAQKMGINNVLMGEMNRVGETVVIAVSLYDIQTGKKQWSTIQKAASPDDLDPIIQFFVNSLNNKNSGNYNGDIYSVTDYNAQNLKRKQANTNWGIELGGGVVLNNEKPVFPAGFGFVISGDIRDFIYDLKINLMFSEVNYSEISTHIQYPLSKKAQSPFLSAGLGFGASSVINNDPAIFQMRERNNGLKLYAGGGYILNRSSDIQLKINANVFVSTYNIQNVAPVGALFGLILLF